MKKFLIFTLFFFCAVILLIFYVYYPTIFHRGEADLEVTLYFITITERDFLLYPVTRSIDPALDGEQLYKRVLELLIAGPQSGEEVEFVLPKETRILDLQVEGNLVQVDFSKEIRNLNVGAQGEEMTIYAIVNTLTEFSGIDSVQLFIEGQNRVSLAGHYLLMDPFTRSEEAIYRE